MSGACTPSSASKKVDEKPEEVDESLEVSSTAER
jgi:hypothetical protein